MGRIETHMPITKYNQGDRMAKSRKQFVKVIPLAIGQDPSLWRYDSVQEALGANMNVLSELIRAGEIAQEEQPVTTEPAIDEDAAPVAAR